MNILFYPNWLYIGSKSPQLKWIVSHLDELTFNSVLDIYGGSGILSYYFSQQGKYIWYNDLLFSTTQMVKGLFQGTNCLVENTYQSIIKMRSKPLYNVFETYFSNYFTLEECQEIDRFMSNLIKLYPDTENPTRNLILYCLSQSLLEKQGKATFHDNTMNRRKNTKDKTKTWDSPIIDLFQKARQEVNKFIVSKDKEKLEPRITNLSDQEIFANPKIDKIDLIYADPPYMGTTSNKFGNYVFSYHVLEALFRYPNLDLVFRQTNTKLVKPTQDHKQFLQNRKWIQPEEIEQSLEILLHNSSNSILALSYRNDSYYPIKQLQQLAAKYFSDIQIYIQAVSYKSDKSSKYDDVLFIMKNL